MRDTEKAQPILRVIKGHATPEEIAALVAVIASMSGGEAPSKPKPRSSWADPGRRMRTSLPQGPGAWRASGLPR